MIQQVRLLTLLVIFTVLLSCGGGGGGDGGNQPPPPQNRVPQLSVDFPLSSGVTDKATFSTRGSVTDPDGDAITSIRVIDSSGSELLSVQPTASTFSLDVPLSNGVNDLTIEARDSNGGISTREIRIRKDIFLGRIVAPVYSAGNDRIYFTAQGTYPLLPTGPNALIELDPATGIRRIVSGNGVGVGPEFVDIGVLIENSISDTALVYDFGRDAAIRIDLASGDRTIAADLSGIAEFPPHGIVFDAARNRLLANRHYNLWEFSFSDSSASLVAQLNVANGNASLKDQSLAISEDSNTLYLDGGGAIAQVDAGTYSVTETVLNNPTANFGMVPDEPNSAMVYGASQTIYRVELGSGAELDSYLAPGETGPLEFIGRGRTPTEVLAVDSRTDRILALDYQNETYDIIGGSTRGRGASLRSEYIAVLEGTSRLLSMSFSTVPANLDFGLLEIDVGTGDRIPTDIGSFPDPSTGGAVSDAATGIIDFGKGRTADEVLWLSDGQQALYAIAANTGDVSTVANFQGDSRPGRFCLDNSNGTAYLADFNSDRLISLNLSDGSFETISSFDSQVATGPRVTLLSMACDNAGQRILAVTLGSLMEIDYQTGDRRVLFDANDLTGESVDLASVLAVSGDGTEVYVSALSTGGFADLFRIDLAVGRIEAVLKDPAPSMFRPLAMEFLDESTAYVLAEWGNLWSVDLQSGERLLISR